MRKKIVSTSFVSGFPANFPNLAISLMFSGEEVYGRYLDLNANHTTYNNLRNLPKRITYLQYLDQLLAAQHGYVHKDLPQETRSTKEFEA